ncbi:heme exporter protein CcmD [Acidisoma sp. C75]
MSAVSPWPFIGGAYAVTLIGVLALGIGAFWRHGRAARRLRALEEANPRRRARAGAAGPAPAERQA